MENNKYYTPDIESLCIGYEGEINWNRGYDDVWVPFKIKVQDENSAYTSELSGIVNAVHDGMSEIRTPYLTRESIEKEGWFTWNGLGDPKRTYPELWVSKKYPDNSKKIYSVLYNLETHQMKIQNHDQHILFQGPCSSINEFRYITKLLGI